MRILYYDCFAGISGDMNLGALIDLGVPKEYLLAEIEKLNLKGYKIKCSRELKMGISGTRVDVIMEHHKHSGKDHNHHRNIHDIHSIIEKSSLNSFIKDKSLMIFNEIAYAEAIIHNQPLDHVHFHEVGAIDSIIDIVGAAICIDYLKPDKIIASSIQLGGGFVQCAHGTFPVPAPATAAILKNVPVKKGLVEKETTTPTGAAIIKVFAEAFEDQTEFVIEKVGYGIGHYDLEIPNLLRVYLSTADVPAGIDISNALLMECNIDDMNPEHYDYIIDRLLLAGAQDVFLVPVIMKKSRPAVQLKVLCDSNTQKSIETILFKETTSLGVRYIPVRKSMLKRKSITLDTLYGNIRIKIAEYDGKELKYKAEYNDCVLAAEKSGITLKEIYNEVDRQYTLMKNKS